MTPLVYGKTTEQWINVLQSGNAAERCAAALALGELHATTPGVRQALIDALGDSDQPVQAAAQIALGLVEVDSEHRRKMFFVLTSEDSERRSQVFGSLWRVLESAPATNPIIEKPAVAGEESVANKSMTPGPSVQPPAPDPVAPALETPDISIVHVFPWWFLLGGVAFCITLAWLMRGLWWSSWTIAAMGLLAGLFLLYARRRVRTGGLTPKQYLSRARIGGSILFAGVCGFGIGYFFPAGGVYIDNASAIDARILLDDKEWTTIPAGGSKKLQLGNGRYRLAIQSLQGNQVLDAHDVEIVGYQQYVCNVLGAQIYFHGKLQYGGERGVDMKPVIERWFAVPEVDYLFRSPPQSLHTRNSVTKTFLSKGGPP